MMIKIPRGNDVLAVVGTIVITDKVKVDSSLVVGGVIEEDSIMFPQWVLQRSFEQHFEHKTDL